MWLTSGSASDRKYSSTKLLKKECYEEEVQPHWKTYYKPMIYIYKLNYQVKLHHHYKTHAPHSHTHRKVQNTLQSPIPHHELVMCTSQDSSPQHMFIHSSREVSSSRTKLLFTCTEHLFIIYVHRLQATLFLH